MCVAMESYTGKYVLGIVNGIPGNIEITEERVKGLSSFPLQSDDVFIVTYPKSGTTLTQQIVRLLRNKGIDDGTIISKAVPWIEMPHNDTIVKEMQSPRTFKSHTNYEFIPGGEPAKSPAKYIYVARNPKDVAVSMYYHASAIKSFQFTGDWNVFYDYYISGKAEGGSWFNHVLEWWKHRDCPNILFLKYEDLLNDTLRSVKMISDFINVHLDDDIIHHIVDVTSFDKMKKIPSTDMSWMKVRRKDGSQPFLRKGIIGDWRNHFTNEQCQQFDDLYERQMKDTGLQFTF